MKSYALWGVLFTLSASAQEKLPQTGANKAGFPRTPEGEQIFVDAGRQPNATSSVTFNRTFDETEETWTWRINVTEVAVPNNIYDIGMESANYSQGLHVANIQWQLDWPAGTDTFEDYVTETNRSVQFTTMVSMKPRNITNQYKDEDNGDCTPVLGDECTKSLTDAASKTSSLQYNGIDRSTLNGCEDTLNVNMGNRETSVGIEFNYTPDQTRSDNNTLDRGDTLFYRTSGTYQSRNLTQYTGALQVLVMRFNNNNGGQGESDRPTVLCRIVDKAAADENPDNGDSDEGNSDTGNPDSDNADKPGSAPEGWRHSIGAVLGASLLSTLFTLW